MRPSETISEIKLVWGYLPPLVKYTISGAVLGAVGYLLHQIGPYGALPRGMQYRPPSPQDASWQDGDPRYRPRQQGRKRYPSAERTHEEWRR